MDYLEIKKRKHGLSQNQNESKNMDYLKIKREKKHGLSQNHNGKVKNMDYLKIIMER